MSIQPSNNNTMPPPPGWYCDPQGGSALRWFNGNEWTNQYQRPAQQLASPPLAERRITIHYGFALLALFSLGATLLFGLPMLATSGDKVIGGAGVGMGILWILWGSMWTLVWIAFAIQHTLQGRQR